MTYVNEKLLHDVKTVGWHVLGIKGDATTPDVAHTVGLQQTFGHPELVMVGLKQQTLMSVVADLGKRVANGARLAVGSELDDVLEGFPVRFGAVLPVAHERFLPGAQEFYAGTAFEAVQCLWPDREGRFPDDLSFSANCATVEPDLGDPEWTPIYANWAFEDSYVLACYTTRFVLDGTKPITLVTHDQDGSWQFLCGTTAEAQDCRVIALQSAVKIDASVSALADLPRGWQASREAAGSPWQRIESEPDEDQS